MVDTLKKFLEEVFEGEVTLFLEGDSSLDLTKQHSLANYKITPEKMRAATSLGQEILDLAVEQNVDLKQFSDIQSVMGFDLNSSELTAAELGSYALASGLANTTSTGTIGLTISEYTKEFNMSANTPLAIAIGRQVYGDTNPQSSSTNTLSPESGKPLVSDLEKNFPSITPNIAPHS